MVGTALVLTSLVLLQTPSWILPRSFFSTGPPVEVESGSGGLSCSGYHCEYEIYVVNRSDEEQKVVVLVQSELDPPNTPCKSGVISLGPREERLITMDVCQQPAPGVIWDAYKREAVQISWGVEYPDEISTGFGAAYLLHVVLFVLLFAVGSVLLRPAWQAFRQDRLTKIVPMKTESTVKPVADFCEWPH